MSMTSEALKIMASMCPIMASMKMGGTSLFLSNLYSHIYIYIYSIYLPSANVIQPFTSFIQSFIQSFILIFKVFGSH